MLIVKTRYWIEMHAMCWEKVCYEILNCESKLSLFLLSVSTDCMASIL